MKNLFNKFQRTSLLCMLVLATIFFVGCEKQFEFDLPEAGSQVDTEFPTANFSYAPTSDDFRNIKFTNLSFEAINFAWDFGGGNTSEEEDPIFTFDAEGTYPVTLVATDGNGVTGEVTINVEVVEGPFQPIIQEAGFEDNTLPDGSGDGRDSWRNNDIGGVIQITGSPVTFGDQGAKMPAQQDRIGYQEITVEPETNYDLRFWYTMLTGSSDPFITVSILGVSASGTVTSRDQAQAQTIASVTVNDDTDPAVYLEQELSFNSGENETVAIYFFNGPVECRLDNFTIDVGLPGSVPPSAGFDIEQSEANFLEYNFTNTSTGGENYLWDFGDGNTSTEESPTHIYATPDTYEVTLEVTGPTNLSGTLKRPITILAPVTAAFDYEIDENDHRTVHFTDNSEGDVMLLWEFGDGFQFTGENPSHTYAEDAIYNVTLTAYSLTDNTSEATEMVIIAEGFILQVLNGTFDEFTNVTGDNADAWDMTPNSTVIDNNGNEIESPYRALWNNTALNAYIDATYCSDEQPGSTSGGNNGTRGGKFSDPCRRLYQVVRVEQGTEYTFSIDTRSEAMGVNTEVFILNEEITTEEGINASTSDPAIDGYMEITNDFDTFVTNTLTFTASSNEVVIYVRALGAINGDNEVFLDNVIIE